MNTREYIDLELKYGAHNYHPLPVVLSKAKRVWVWDVEGKKYMDMLCAYSAANQGHGHPKIIQAMKDQSEKLVLTSRAFHNDMMGSFLKYLTEVAEMEMALPMNSGTEAVETGLKIARKWGYKNKKVPENKAEIIVCENNFHGRSIIVVGFSSDEGTYDGFGPYPHGFISIPFNDIEALKQNINENTVGFLVEPIQGEGGVIIPSDGYLKEVRKICDENNVLLILDEVQTGFGRTGKMFAHQHENIKPDILVVGKALSGGLYPISAAITSREIMNVIGPGDHGSTFGGNPLACAIGTAALDVMIEEKLPERSAELGKYFMDKLKTLKSDAIKEVRGKGLFIAIEFKEGTVTGWEICEKLMKKDILAKDAHEWVIRFTPALVITKEELDWAFEKIKEVVEEY